MRPLEISTKLFRELGQKEFVYCHWKSNSHLVQALAGDTDLDLLIQKDKKAKFEAILSKYDFKKIISYRLKRYPGMEDYLGFDLETGKLIHLHVHYKLMIGRRYIKNYHLPIENIVLNDLKILEGVYISSTEMELLLLIIRSCMKLRAKDILLYLLRYRKAPFPINILDEFYFLLKDYSRDKFKDVLVKIDLPLSASRLIGFVEKLSNGKLTLATVFSVRFHIFRALHSFRHQERFRSYKRAFEIVLHLLPGLKKLRPMPKKKLNGNGRSFALVGADGSGKSTLVKDLYSWLSWKLQVRAFYFGLPKTLGFKIVNKFVSFLRLPIRMDLGKVFELFVNFGQYISARRWIWIAHRRFDLSHQIEQFSATGGISIADRYPLSDFRHMVTPMDGPRIRNEWAIDGKKWAEYEEWYYSHISLPTKVFVLRTSFDELRRRKTDLDLKIHKEKAEAINEINNSSGVCIINANEPYAKVLLDIKRKIWKLL